MIGRNVGRTFLLHGLNIHSVADQIHAVVAFEEQFPTSLLQDSGTQRVFRRIISQLQVMLRIAEGSFAYFVYQIDSLLRRTI